MFCREADLFFEPPDTRENRKGTFGVLHLLRKDISRCMGYDPPSRQRTSHPTLWPGAMAILAGVDLLGKFLAGSDDTAPGQVGKRFRDYINRYFRLISPGHEEIIYQLRNALLHSFGLYSRNKKKEYLFLLTTQSSTLIKVEPGNRYLVGITALNHSFEDSIERYKNDLESDKMLQQCFAIMFSNYGAIDIL